MAARALGTSIVLSTGLALSFAGFAPPSGMAVAFLPAAILASTAGFGVGVAAILRRERLASSEAADAAEVAHLSRLARAHRRSLRTRGRPFCRRC